MRHTVSREHLKQEERIVWLEDPGAYDYVREAVVYCGTRNRRPPYGPEGGNHRNALGDYSRMVGYAVLRKDARGNNPGMFERRILWRKTYDRGEPTDDGTYARGSPSEAVDPLTVEAGKCGEKTDRLKG